MIPQTVYDLCQSKETVSSLLAQDPTLTPAKAAKKLYGHGETGLSDHKHARYTPASAEDLQRAFECGNWGPTRPSDFFLQVGLFSESALLV